MTELQKRAIRKLEKNFSTIYVFSLFPFHPRPEFLPSIDFLKHLDLKKVSWGDLIAICYKDTEDTIKLRVSPPDYIGAINNYGQIHQIFYHNLPITHP